MSSESESFPPGVQPPAQGPLRAAWAMIQARLRSLTTGSVNRRVMGATLLIGTLTLGIKVLALLKESVVAAAYGTGSSFDAFIIAQLLPMTLISIISGSLNAALIPSYIEVRDQDSPQAAHRLYTTVLMLNAVLLVLVTIIMGVTAKIWLPLIASGFDPDKLALTRTLLYGSLPMVVMAGFCTTWGALLNAGERFALVAIAPALQPLAIVGCLGLLLSSMGIYALLIGTLLGVALETATVGIALARQGHPLTPKWHGSTPAFRRVLGQYGACISSAFLVSGMGLVDQAMASSLGPRSNSALNYGSKLVMLILTLGAASLGTAILPQLSRMVAANDLGGVRHFLKQYTRIILTVTVPFVLVMIFLSRPIIRLFFQHGAFSAADTDLVVQVQIFYLIRIPFSTCLVLVTRSLTALKANHFMTVMSVGSFVLNILLNYVLMTKYGIAGITLSTSICSMVILLCLSLALHRLLQKRAAKGSL